MQNGGMQSVRTANGSEVSAGANAADRTTSIVQSWTVRQLATDYLHERTKN